MTVSQTNGIFLKNFTAEETVDMMANGGFDAIDFDFSREEYHGEHTDSLKGKDRFLYLKDYANSKGIYFNQAHAPFPSGTNDKSETDAMFHSIVRSMRNASYLGVKNIIVHPKHHLVYKESGNPEKLFEENMKFYKSLQPYCEEYGVRVCLENLWQGFSMIAGWRVVCSVCSKPEEYLRYLNNLDSDCFGACLDIGHAIIVHEDPADYIHKLGNRLVALHVHDVDGLDDCHMMPFHGGMADWDKITQALRDTNYNGDFTLEVLRLFSPLPLCLYPAAIRLLAETGKYLANMIYCSDKPQNGLNRF